LSHRKNHYKNIYLELFNINFGKRNFLKRKLTVLILYLPVKVYYKYENKFLPQEQPYHAPIKIFCHRYCEAAGELLMRKFAHPGNSLQSDINLVTEAIKCPKI